MFCGGTGLRIQNDILRFSWRAVLTSVVFYISSQPRETAPQNWGVQWSEAAPQLTRSKLLITDWYIYIYGFGIELVHTISTEYIEDTADILFEEGKFLESIAKYRTVCCTLYELVICSQHWLYSLWLSDAIWRHRSGSTLAHVMAWCLVAPSHYLNQYCLTIKDVLWYSLKSNFKYSWI